MPYLNLDPDRGFNAAKRGHFIDNAGVDADDAVLSASPTRRRSLKSRRNRQAKQCHWRAITSASSLKRTAGQGANVFFRDFKQEQSPDGRLESYRRVRSLPPQTARAFLQRIGNMLFPFCYRFFIDRGRW